MNIKIFLVSIISCVSQKSDIEFIKKYGRYDFSNFEGAHLVLRYKNEESSLLSFYCRDGDVNNFHVTCEMSSDYKLSILQQSGNIDTIMIQNRVSDFLKFNIRSLEVSSSRVKVGLLDNDDLTDLFKIRVNDGRLTMYERENYTRITNNWYSRNR